MVFPAGITSVSFNVSVTDDNILEQNETFALTIDSTSNVIVGGSGKAIITILDDDSK